MTKIKNTKKGMAKKTLSISLAVAMLATSNVPVWAAEFTDGTDAAFTSEAPVVEDVVEEVLDSRTSADGVSTNENVRVKGLDMPTSVTFGDTITANDGEFVTDITGTEVLYSGSWTAAWRVAGEKQNFWEQTVTNDNWKTLITLPTSDSKYAKYAGETLELRFYAKNDVADFDICVQQVKVNEKGVSDSEYYFDASFKDNRELVYDGKEFTAADIVVNNILKSDGTIAVPKEDVEKYFKITAQNAKNAGDEFIIYATAKSDVPNNPYTGTISQTLTVGQRPFVVSDFVLKYAENTQYEYTGAVIKPELDKVTVTETKATAEKAGLSGADLTSAVFKVAPAENATADVGSKDMLVYLEVAKLPNFSFTSNQKGDVDGVEVVKVGISNAYKIVERDLAKCTLTIKDVPVRSTVANLENPASGYVIVKDANGNVLPLQNGDFDLIAIDPADSNTHLTSIDRTGVNYTGYIIAANNNNNVKGKTKSVSFKAVENVITVEAQNTITLEYNGQEQKPTASDFGALTLIQRSNTDSGSISKNEFVYQSDAWEIVDYKDNKDAGTATAIVKTKEGDFANRQFAISFTITPLQVEAKNVAVPKNVVYDKSIKAASEYGLPVSVKATSRTGKSTSIDLTDKDFSVAYDYVETSKNRIGNTIQAVVTVTNKNYITTGLKRESVSAEKTTKIVGGILEDSFIKLNKTSYVYTGGKITPDFKVMNDTLELEKDTDYVVKDIENGVDVGTATLVLEGRGKYAGSTAKTTFEITPANIEDITVTVKGAEYRGGKQVRPDVDAVAPNGTLSVSLNNNIITNQFEVSAYGPNNTAGEDAGSVTVKVLKSSKNFTGTTKTVNFDIKAYELSGTLEAYDNHGSKITNFDDLFTYDGTEKKFASVKFIPSDASRALGVTENDYEIKYVNNIYGDADGKGSVIVVGKEGGNFAGDSKNVIKDYVNNKEIKGYAAKLDFAIGSLKFDGTNVTVKNGVYAGGLPVKPQVTVQFGGKTLEEGKDYILEIPSKTEVTSTAKWNIVVKGINGYKDSYASSEAKWPERLISRWGIDKQTIANCDVTVNRGEATVYNGSVKVPTSEYTVKKNDDGTYTVVAKTTSKNYVGSQIVKDSNEVAAPGTPMISKVEVIGNKATVILSGACDGATGYDYVIGTDKDCINSKDYYKVNKNKLTTTTPFTYVEQGTYYAYCHAWTRDENGKKVFSEWSNAYPIVVSAITPAQPVIKSVKVKGSTVTVTYTGSANAEGYDVVLGNRMATVNDEKRPVEYGKLVKKGQKSTTVTFKNVPDGTYYVGLHAYNRTSEDGKKVFSPWSQAKKITVR